jgi:hypothetical protein
MQPLPIFIGYDPRQPVSYNVLQHSIAVRASRPVAITPLIIEQLPITRRGLTSFTFTRFLVPWLCGYQGTALYLDIDMLVLADIAELFGLMDDSAVMVSQNRLKYEWASVMLFNCAHPDNRVLTPEYVSAANKLHSISWTRNVGRLPGEWNHLVMYDPPAPAKLVHFTAGIPAYPETRELGYAKEWQADATRATSAKSWEVIMGPSIHAAHVKEFLQGRREGRSADELLPVDGLKEVSVKEPAEPTS